MGVPRGLFKQSVDFPSSPSGVDLTFATSLTEGSQSECQILNSTKNMCLLVGLSILRFAKVTAEKDANVRIGPPGSASRETVNVLL